jgi:hypothetical protein
MALVGRIFAAESPLEGTMVRRFLQLAVLAIAMSLLVGCATQGPVSGQTPSLVGAWLVTSARGSGVGKNMLTFSSDGTFFRSGDTHPVLSGGHGAWRQVSPGEFEATYIAFRFDGNRKWVGSTKTRLLIKLGESPNEFTGTATAVNRDLEDKPVGGGKAKLEGKRIVVEGQ